jgi:hypothetical protein
MLYLFRLLLLLINIDQETVLNWFGIEDPTIRQITSGQDLNFSSIEASTDVSIDTVGLIIRGLWDNIQTGLNLADIENILFFILFVRFIILAVRYNLKTSFYITSIGLFAGYLWYKHLIDTIVRYKDVLTNLPLLSRLGTDAVQIATKQYQGAITESKLGENTNWYNPGQLIYYSIIKGIVNVDPETGRKYYIDPISMIISKFPESTNSPIVSLYYKLYHTIIPKIFNICKNFWNQLSGVAAYAVITRIGKRYCPYLVRWHWTLLLIVGFVEGIVISFVDRANGFKIFLNTNADVAISSNIQVQTQFLNLIIASVVLAHVGFLIFALFHAVWGQYFYVPFFVENTELHIGPRPKNSIYSGGNTAWQDQEEKEKKLNRVLPKLWYGWFGKGTQNSWQLISNFQKFINKIIKKFKKQFRR